MKRFWFIGILMFMAAAVVPACDDDSVGVGPDPGRPTTSCRELVDYMHTSALAVTPGPCLGVAGAGNIVVTAGDGGLAVFDVSRPVSAQRRAVIDTTGVARDVDISGDIAVAAYGQSGAVVVDISDPDSPSILSALSTPGEAVGVAVEGALAFVADNQVGLVIVDIRDPGAPVYRGVENTPGEATAVAIVGDLALVSDAVLGLRVVNVAQPDAPWLVSSVSTPGTALDVAAAGGFAYIADAQSGVQVVDIRNPAAASIVSNIAIAARATAVAAGGGRVYVADGPNGVTVYDASDPVALRMLTRSSSASVSTGMRVVANRLYVAETTGVARVVEIKDAVSPPLQPVDIAVVANDVFAVASDSTLVYAVSKNTNTGNGILTIVDAKENRVLGDMSFTGTPAHDVVVSDGFAYIATENNAVVIVDVSDPSQPSYVARIGIRDASGVAVVDSALCIAHLNGLSVHPLGGSQSPGAVSTTGGAVSVVADRGFAYVATLGGRLYSINLGNLQVFDIATLGTRAAGLGLQRIPDAMFPEFLYDLFVYACVMTATGPGVQILDAENRGFPVPVQFVRTAGAAVDVVVAGNTMYVATGDDDIEVFDVSDLVNPRPIGTIVPPGGIAYGVAFTNDRFAAAAGPSGLLLAPRNCSQ